MLNFLFPNHSNFPLTHLGTVLDVLLLTAHLNFTSLQFADTRLLLIPLAISTY